MPGRRLKHPAGANLPSYQIGKIPLSKPNVKLANKIKAVKLKDGSIKKIAFDNRGYPIFDDYTKYTAVFEPSKFRAESYSSQLRMATRNLRDSIKSGKVSKSAFSQAQLKAIKSGSDKIPGYTWHHHQHTGRMQLVPDQIHGAARHVGLESMSKGQ